MRQLISFLTKLLLLTTVLFFTAMWPHLSVNHIEGDQTRACCKTSAKACAPIPITTITTISIPGHYCLAHALVGATPLISIATSDVLLDLNGQFLQTTGATEAILFDNTTGRSNITITNGAIHGSGIGSIGILINVSLDSTTNDHIVLSNLNIDGCTNNGISAVTFDTLVIDRCNLHGCDSNLFLIGSNTIIKDSAFNESVSGYGALLSRCNAVVVNNSSFNFNSFGGMHLVDSKNIIVSNAYFLNNQGDGCTGLNAFDLTFDHCSFSENVNKGIFIDAPTLSPFLAVGYKFVECQAMNNCDNGFTFSTATSDIVLSRCVASGNCPGNGFVLTTTIGSIATVVECVAQDNSTGFDMSASFGNGLIKACNASGNGLANLSDGCFSGGGCAAGGCGFNDRATSLYQYVSNVAQGNGLNPAAGMVSTTTDTNYCINGAPTEYTPITGGPGVSAPFSQLGRSTNTNMFNAGITAWDNVTLQ